MAWCLKLKIKMNVLRSKWLSLFTSGVLNNVCGQNDYGSKTGAGLAVVKASSDRNQLFNLFFMIRLVQNTAISKFAKHREWKLKCSSQYKGIRESNVTANLQDINPIML